jgi:hypothetical protein
VTKVRSVVLVAIAALLAAGGLLMVTSMNYASGALVIQSDKTQQFSYGFGLLILGVIGFAIVVGIYVVNGRNSLVRRRPYPWWPRPTS